MGYLFFGFFTLYYISSKASWKYLDRHIDEIKLLQAIKVNYTNRDVEILLKSDEDDTVWQSEDDACFTLKLSRASYTSSPQKSEDLLNKAINCPRKELVMLWAGDLAWTKGNTGEAQKIWSELSDNGLLELGYRYFLEENYSKALAVLESINLDSNIDLSQAQRIKYYRALGDIFQRTAQSLADWEAAASNYQRAWDLGGKDYLLGYLLGLSYSRLNRCAEAIPIFEAGLIQKPVYPYPLTNSSYFIELGLCQVALGRLDQAAVSSVKAKQYLDLARGNIPEEYYSIELEKLENLNNSINK